MEGSNLKMLIKGLFAEVKNSVSVNLFNFEKILFLQIKMVMQQNKKTQIQLISYTTANQILTV